MDNFDEMARAYGEKLKVPFGVTERDRVERAIVIEEEQLDIIASLASRTSNRQAARLLGYLKNVKSNAVIALHRLVNSGDYIPAFHCGVMQQPFVYSLLDKQISLFVLLDTIPPSEGLSQIKILENRALGIISILTK